MNAPYAGEKNTPEKSKIMQAKRKGSNMSKHVPVIVTRGIIENGIDAWSDYTAEDLLDCDGPNEEVWVISWPEHVVIPSYNGDADFRGPYKSVGTASEENPCAEVHRDLL